MGVTGTKDRYLVVGNPIAHSQSPLIHRQFAELTGQNLCYDKQSVALDGFDEFMEAFFNQGGKGCNITLPFKEQACLWADRLTERAQAAGAVNTLHREPNGQILGDNTDGQGLVEDLLRLGIPLQGKRMLLLGAGGAARGAIMPLLQQQPAHLVIANRSVDRAHALAQTFAHAGNVTACALEELTTGFDIIINSTSASLSGELPAVEPLVVASAFCCYDMAYGPQETRFLQWAGELGVTQRFDGLGMLVSQAAESFNLWRGVRPPVTPVLEQLRHHLQP